ncbi:hypothetical protein C1I60_08915 [Paenibacillus terrae]|uniref:Uncharacterized protein n=1 Tax=Paenibacillus terrae TaxID=159743 RepID=A0A4U2Q5T1_9BACL|nr:hypothetical protein C1I60_08915 [Paenibacillus terrae]
MGEPQEGYPYSYNLDFSYKKATYTLVQADEIEVCLLPKYSPDLQLIIGYHAHLWYMYKGK